MIDQEGVNIQFRTDSLFSKFQVISDFDHTLSRSHDEEGGRCPVTHEVFGNRERFPEIVEKVGNWNYILSLENRKGELAAPSFVNLIGIRKGFHTFF